MYQKVAVTVKIREESFFLNFKVLAEERSKRYGDSTEYRGSESGSEVFPDRTKSEKGEILPVRALHVKEGETSPPKRYNSGSMILAMENAGQLIEDEELA